MSENREREERRPGPGGPGRGPRGMMEHAKAKEAKGTFKRLLKYISEHIGRIVLISILCAVSALISILITRLAGIAVDDYIAVGDMPGLARLVGVSLLLYAVTTVCSYFQNTNMIYVAQKTSFKLRKDLFDCLCELPLKYFDTHSSGDIMSRLTNDVDNVSNTLSQSVTQLFSGVINVVGTLVAMIMLSPLLTLISMLTMPLMFLVTRIIARFSRRFFREQQKNLGTINGYIEEMVSGQKVIKLFSREEENKRDFAGLNANLRRSGTKAEVVAGVMGPFMNMISNITYLIVAVAGGWLAIRSANGLGGTVTIGGPIAAHFSAQKLALGMFTKSAGLERKVHGTADIEAAFGGTTGNPSADVTIAANNGGFQGSTFDALDGEFHLKNGLVDVKNFSVEKSINGKDYMASAKGIVPLKALFANREEELNDYERIKLTVSLDQADLSILPFVSDQIDWALGPTKGKLEITGTPAHPLVKGSVSLSDGAVKFKPLTVPVTGMTAQVDFNGDSMTVRDFSGKMGEGTYAGQGTLKMNGLTPASYDFSLTADKLDIESDFFKGPLSGQLRVNNDKFFGLELPKISGQIDLADCTISVPAIPNSDGELPDIILDADVNVGDRVHAYSSYLYDMYLTGNVHFGGTTRHPKTSGSVSVKRGGTINYLKTEFNVREGTAYFNQVDSFLPSITFLADTRLTQAKVFLSITGPLDNMTFTLKSTPEMSQSEIIRLLTLRDAYKAGQANLDAGDLLIVGLQMSFLSEVEDVMRNMLWLDRFTIARGSGSAFDTHDEESNKAIDVYHVEMGKYISDKVMFKYTQQIGGDDTHRFGLQYDMNDRFGLSLEKEAQKFIVGLEARIHF